MAEKVLDKSWIGLAHDIRNVASGGSTNDDNKTSLRQIMFWIRTYYADLIVTEIEKKSLGILNFNIDENLFNDLGCIPLIEVDAAECGCSSTGCVVLRTPKVPKILSILGKMQIRYVGGIDRSYPFTKTTPENLRGKRNNRFGSNTTYWWWKNDYIYVSPPVVNSILDCINIQAITEDFAAVMPQCGQGKIITPCYDIWSVEAPIPDKYIRLIRQNILTNELNIMVPIPVDKTNDGAHG